MGPESEDPGTTVVADGDAPSNVLILPSERRSANWIRPTSRLGALGRPFDHRAPFFVGLTAALRCTRSLTSSPEGSPTSPPCLSSSGLALFVRDIGLNLILEFLANRGLKRGPGGRNRRNY